MTLEEIKAAVRAGKTVHWHNEGYTVQVDQLDQWFITWSRGGRGESSVGLFYCDDKGSPTSERLIEDSKNFYIATPTQGKKQ